jgi:hypothetical protein
MLNPRYTAYKKDAIDMRVAVNNPMTIPWILQEEGCGNLPRH